MLDRKFGTPTKAHDASVYVVTRESVREFPNLWVGPALDQLTRVSDANPQQSQYRWPTAELVQWMSDDRVPLKGVLYKPEGFDPTKQYPMVVYYYEHESDRLHVYQVPAGRNVVNPSVYTSYGYLVFMPDIVYTTGYPGASALKSVIPGIQSIVARGFVNRDAIGCAGQSWGGYQTAYMVTQTHLFKACFAGAPVANMTSAYGGIRWGSGKSRQFQYEHEQSRIGGSLWTYRDRFIENSPLFYADKITTPLLIMSNDNDEAVPWAQGIEFFTALRRLGKEAYLVNYNGDFHNPVKDANKKDIDHKMLQFFGHFLKGEPAPDWMTKGVPYVTRNHYLLGVPPSPSQPPAPRD
jgi:dipeptidyl aminopeptidase/acylaminoacyl peptidase